VGPGRARDRAKIPAGIRNTCKTAVSEQRKLAKVQLRRELKMRTVQMFSFTIAFIATTTGTEAYSAQRPSRISFPIVAFSVHELAPFGVVVLQDKTPLPSSFHLCYDYGAGGDQIAVSHERLARYRELGFSLNSLCLGLMSESRFDPETGSRLPTFVMAETDTSTPNKVSVVSYEHPLELPVCYRRALPFTDCTFNYDRLTGKRLSLSETKKVTNIGLTIDGAMKSAIAQRLVCTWPFCFERWPKMEDYGREGSLSAGGFDPIGCFNLGYVPAFFNEKLAPRGIPIVSEEELRSLHISCYDISINLPAGYGYTTDADGAAGSFVSPELVKLALEPGRRVGQIDPKKLATVLKSYTGSNVANKQQLPR
jgi:hypothetical protein